MQIMIPMSTRSDFFPERDFYFPKPLIEVNGDSMINWVIDNLSANIKKAEFFFVVNKEDSRLFSIGDALQISLEGKATIIEKNNETSGALCSALLAIDSIDHSEPLIISNCDQYLDLDITEEIAKFQSKDADAGVLTFESVHPRWSYVVAGYNGRVMQTFEKKVASKHAIAGLYYFKRAGDFFQHAEAPIMQNISVGSNFYLSSVLNEFILNDKNVFFSEIQSNQYHSFYAPSTIKNFERIMSSRGSENDQ
jgi:NDP-sugar pyrophosphorylase family protein